MTFKDENRKSNIINGPAIAKEVSDQSFEQLIQQVKDLSREERINVGRNTFGQLIEKFQILWDESETAFIEPMIIFINFATQIGCAGLKEVTTSRKQEVASYFQDIEAIKNLVEAREDYFDFSDFCDEAYQSLVNGFLCGSLDPLFSDYPNILFTYMILVACADSVNAPGLNAIRKLRNDYFWFAFRKKENMDLHFEGTLEEADFMKEDEPAKAADHTTSDLDYRCYFKFRDKSMWRKVMEKLCFEATNNEKHTLLEISSVFSSISKMMKLMHEPIGEIFDTVTAVEDEGFCFIHDHRKTYDFFVSMTEYIFEELIELAKDSFVLVADLTDYSTDMMGDQLFYYCCGDRSDLNKGVVEGPDGLDHHDIEISNVKEMLQHESLNDKQKRYIDEIVGDSYPENLMDSMRMGLSI